MTAGHEGVWRRDGVFPIPPGAGSGRKIFGLLLLKWRILARSERLY